jgi:hypothetical protein
VSNPVKTLSFAIPTQVFLAPLRWLSHAYGLKQTEHSGCWTNTLHYAIHFAGKYLPISILARSAVIAGQAAQPMRAVSPCSPKMRLVSAACGPTNG